MTRTINDSLLRPTSAVFAPDGALRARVVRLGKNSPPADASVSGDDLIIVRADGRSHYAAPTGFAAIVVPLAGAVQVATGDGRTSLAPGQLLVADFDRKLEIASTGEGRWLALLTSESAWRAVGLVGVGAMPTPLPPLPSAHTIEAHRAEAIVDLADRIGAQPGGVLSTTDMLDLGVFVAELQSRFVAEIGRCPGKTFARKLNAFCRLQRVRNHIAANCGTGLPLRQLARLANYSTCHLVRAFTEAFGETPSSYLTRLRLETARALLAQPRFAVSDVASACGFESRTAFSRAFKRHFGSSPSECSERAQRSQRGSAGASSHAGAY